MKKINIKKISCIILIMVLATTTVGCEYFEEVPVEVSLPKIDVVSGNILELEHDVESFKFKTITWKDDIRQGFNECMRVLRPNGTLIFKWNEEQIKLREILSAIKYKPLFGNRRSKTHWLVFMKD